MRYRFSLLAQLPFHSLRRSFGSWMAKEGVPITTIAQMLGHCLNKNISKQIRLIITLFHKLENSQSIRLPLEKILLFLVKSIL
ncbi:tyrosine-type recombinase/integrase [Clostridium estertheticum]|uniref:tyrosine-type recombinase/integrase n=1 Tax=Clostridium estertheticum TaxID=238834 RepID=UPI001CCD4190|nr:tyrosine-type recombinase/integrase [Clostridium estertheticum subsp. laramiense]WAG76123.1 tyrosine-type recombinase/integrase [Clostridium estertheticum]